GSPVAFAFQGAPDAYTVPAGVCSVTLDALGAAGGRGGGTDADHVGQGGEIVATLKVSPGEVLSVNVGGRGNDGEQTNTRRALGGAGGWNGGGAGGDAVPTPLPGASWLPIADGGGGGGGASDVRQGGADISNRVVVAPGGGGASGGSIGIYPGVGGAGGN